MSSLNETLAQDEAYRSAAARACREAGIPLEVLRENPRILVTAIETLKTGPVLLDAVANGQSWHLNMLADIKFMREGCLLVLNALRGKGPARTITGDDNG